VAKGNPNPKPKATKYPEVSGNMRNAFYKGLTKAARRRQQTLSEFCADWWEEDRNGAANAMAKFMPREIKGNLEVNHTLTLEQVLSGAILEHDQPPAIDHAPADATDCIEVEKEPAPVCEGDIPD
jgi:hypothetical protein